MRTQRLIESLFRHGDRLRRTLRRSQDQSFESMGLESLEGRVLYSASAMGPALDVHNPQQVVTASVTAADNLKIAAPDPWAIEGTPQANDQFGSSMAVGDFNGDGYDDLATGVPTEDVNGHADAGAVNVMYGGAPASGVLWIDDDQIFTQDGLGTTSPEAGDWFGRILAAGDFNADGFDDLAIGSPFEDNIFNTIPDGGAVHVLYGSATGLTMLGHQEWTQNSPGLGSSIQPEDHFGRSLATGDFDGDGFEDLAIGIPDEDHDITGQINTGAVQIIFGSPSKLTSAGAQYLHQDTPGILGVANAHDTFGASLAAGDFNNDGRDDLAIGVTGETINGQSRAGAVAVVHGSTSGLSVTGDQLWHQNSPGIAGVAEAGDQFGEALAVGDFDGDGFDDLAVGVAREDFNGANTKVDAGVVNVIYGTGAGLSSAGDQIWHQNRTGIPSLAESFDYFGWSLTTGDFNNDGFDELVVGVPFEDHNSLGVKDGGAVHVIYGSLGTGLTSAGDEFWHENSGSLWDSPDSNDRFAVAVAAGDFDGDGYDDLAISVPGADIFDNGWQNDAGALHVLFGWQWGTNENDVLYRFQGWHPVIL